MKKTIVALLLVFFSLCMASAQLKDIKTALDEANKLYKTIEELESVIEIKRAEYIKNQVKDEFESTEEFKERLERELRSKYRSDFEKLDSFKKTLSVLSEGKHIFPKDSFRVELVKYNADNCEYEINLTNFMIKNPDKKDEWLLRKLALKIDAKTAKEIKTNWGSYPVELYGKIIYDGQNYTVGAMELRFLDIAKTNLARGEINIIPYLKLVFVDGGTFKSTKSNYYGKGVTVDSFYIGKYEVTQKEWIEVMGSNPSEFKGDNLPVENVSWYDCVEYCNKRSEIEGLTPVYMIDKTNKDLNNSSTEDDIKWTVTADWSANGYRLPTDAEWEYAATGGQLSKSCEYSGSENLGNVAWYASNSNSSAKSIGTKKSNELGIYDMSGNLWEWAWDWYGDIQSGNTNPKGLNSGSGRILKGGGWYGFAAFCKVVNRINAYPSYKSNGYGFRVVRRGE